MSGIDRGFLFGILTEVLRGNKRPTFTITLPEGGNYIGIECENFTGNIELNIE